MSYLVFCTFDLRSATGSDYANAYADLERLGLSKVQTSAGGKAVIPTTSAMGLVTGASAEGVRDAFCASIQQLFAARKFKSEIFVAVGGSDWGWGSRTT